MGLFNLFKKKKKEVVWDKTMQLVFCFKANTLTIGDVLELMDSSKEFKASAVNRERDFEVLTATRYHELKNANKAISEILFADGLSFLDQYNNQWVYVETFQNTDKYQLLYWRVDSLQFLDSLIFKELIARPDFILAYCYNQQDSQVQNTYERQFEEIANIPGKYFVTYRATWYRHGKAGLVYTAITKNLTMQRTGRFNKVLKNGWDIKNCTSNHNNFAALSRSSGVSISTPI